MKVLPLALVAMSLSFAGPGLAANPYLTAKGDQPVTAEVRGKEWNDEYIDGDIPLTMRMVTTRIASMPWGAIFKIEFAEPTSRATQKREIRPLYFIATNDRIFLLNEEDNEAAAKKMSSQEKAPDFQQSDVRAITAGKMKFEEGPYTTEITVKGDQCSYMTSHNSGHYQKFVWKKGTGLVEHASNYGAAKDGYDLKRVGSKK